MEDRVKNLIQTKRNLVKNKTRTCMWPECNKPAIKSHVLQKNGILRQISEDNHLIELRPTNINEIENKGILEFNRSGVNNAYTFSGFCNEHDSNIFKEIEDENSINLYNPLHQCLFSYRGLCQEIRRKEIMSEWIHEISPILDPLTNYHFDALNDGYKLGIKNLLFFKSEIENAINKSDYTKFKFTTIKLPKIELCISVPLNISDDTNTEMSEQFNRNADGKKSFPFPTSFINLFPYKQDSYFISGYHKDFPCKWTDKLTNKLSYLRNKKLNKELSDLVVLRLEFWLMSPKLFKKISSKRIEEYKYIFSKYVMSHDARLKTKLNLFDF